MGQKHLNESSAHQASEKSLPLSVQMNQLHGNQQIPQRKSHTVSTPPSLRPPATTLVASPSATRLSAADALAPGFSAMVNR